MRILVVEDDFLVAEAIRRGLCMSGFAVDCASDAEQATVALAAEHFDLALLDIALPGADGLTILRRLRADARVIQNHGDGVLALDVVIDEQRSE